MRNGHTAYCNLVESWKSSSLNYAPYLHKDDGVLRSDDATPHVCTHESFQGFLGSEDLGVAEDKKLHLGLLPVPYYGDLATARVFILMLNPGLSNPGLSYYAQENDWEGRQRQLATIRQEGLDKEFPLIDLDPSLPFRSTYWRSKLDGIVRLAMANCDLDYRRALSRVAQQVAVLQLFPYRSTSFHLPRKIKNELQSSKLIVSFVSDCLLEEAKAGDSLIVAVRGARHWGVHKQKNVLVYSGPGARSASLSPGTKGGNAIARHLGLC